MSVNAPEFGRRPSLKEIKRHVSRFEIEMLRCSRGPPGQKGTSLNILHKSTDIGAAEHEINRIVQFLKAKGFSVARESYPQKISNTDMLLIGTTKDTAASAMWLANWSRLMLGLVLQWDVLLYGDISKKDVHLPPYKRPRLSGSMFHVDAINLVDAYMQRQSDIAAWRGRFIDMTTEVEAKLGKCVKTGGTLKNKIEALEKTIDNPSSCDARLALAALRWVRLFRNSCAHMSIEDAGQQTKWNKYAADSSKDFFGVVKSCKRHDLDICMPDNDAYMMRLFRFHIRIFVLVSAWLDELALQ